MRTVDLLNLLITIADYAALIFWLRSWRQSRKPAVTAMVLALLMLSLSVSFGASNVVFPVPTGLASLWITLIVHCLVLGSDYWWQVFALRVVLPLDETVRPTRWRRNVM